MDQHRRHTQHLPSNWSPFTLRRAVPILVPHTTVPWQSPRNPFLLRVLRGFQILLAIESGG